MSQAGINRVGQRGGETILVLNPSTAGANLDSGLWMVEGIGFKTWQFMLIGPAAQMPGYSVTIYGTFDPAAYDIFWQANAYSPNLVNPNLTGQGSTLLPPTSWFVLPGAAEQSGTGLSQNPMVSGGAGGFTSQVLVSSLALVGVRAVGTITGTPTDNVSVLAFAIP